MMSKPSTLRAAAVVTNKVIMLTKFRKHNLSMSQEWGSRK